MRPRPHGPWTFNLQPRTGLDSPQRDAAATRTCSRAACCVQLPHVGDKAPSWLVLDASQNSLVDSRPITVPGVAQAGRAATVTATNRQPTRDSQPCRTLGVMLRLAFIWTPTAYPPMPSRRLSRPHDDASDPTRTHSRLIGAQWLRGRECDAMHDGGYCSLCRISSRIAFRCRPAGTACASL